MISFKLVRGNIFKQKVDCIVNPWNMNFIPYQLLFLTGVSGQLKKFAGTQPFEELKKMGVLLPGKAVLTISEKFPIPIIHVVGLNWYWRSSLEIVEKCIENAIELAVQNNYKSIAIPLVGATSGLSEDTVIEMITGKLRSMNQDIKVIIVQCDK